MSTGNVSLRQKWIAYWRSMYATWDAGHNNHPPFPDELRDMRCEAKTRSGTPCRMKVLYSNGRCKLHGGLSTGPKTEAGKARAAQNWQGSQPRDEPLETLTKPMVSTSENLVLRANLALNFVTEIACSSDPNPDSLDPRSPKVRCVDCKNLSAGHTCLLGLSGSLPMGVPRQCEHYGEPTHGHF